MSGEGGIDDGVSSSLIDPAFQYELYCNWKNNLTKCTPPISVAEFCKNKGITSDFLEEINRTFNENHSLRI